MSLNCWLERRHPRILLMASTREYVYPRQDSRSLREGLGISHVLWTLWRGSVHQNPRRVELLQKLSEQTYGILPKCTP